MSVVFKQVSFCDRSSLAKAGSHAATELIKYTKPLFLMDVNTSPHRSLFADYFESRLIALRVIIHRHKSSLPGGTNFDTLITIPDRHNYFSDFDIN